MNNDLNQNGTGFSDGSNPAQPTMDNNAIGGQPSPAQPLGVTPGPAAPAAPAAPEPAVPVTPQVTDSGFSQAVPPQPMGAPIQIQQPTQPAAPAVPQQPVMTPQQMMPGMGDQQPKNNNKLFIIIAAVLVLIIGGLIAVVVLNKDDGESNNNNKTSNKENKKDDKKDDDKDDNDVADANRYSISGVSFEMPEGYTIKKNSSNLEADHKSGSHAFLLAIQGCSYEGCKNYASTIKSELESVSKTSAVVVGEKTIDGRKWYIFTSVGSNGNYYTEAFTQLDSDSSVAVMTVSVKSDYESLYKVINPVIDSAQVDYESFSSSDEYADNGFAFDITLTESEE